jgi:predicted ester cyclase
MMATKDNLAVIQHFMEIMENGKLAEVDQIIAPNWVNHDPTLPPMQGLEGARQLANLYHSAFSNIKTHFEDTLGEGDKVAIRFRFTALNSGPFLNMPATGKTVDILATGIFKVVNGKLTDNWVNLDSLGMMQQLGFVPKP